MSLHINSHDVGQWVALCPAPTLVLGLYYNVCARNASTNIHVVIMNGDHVAPYGVKCRLKQNIRSCDVCLELFC